MSQNRGKNKKPMDTYTKILVVDDEPDIELLIKQKFRREIREKVIEFMFAENGARALEVLESNQDIDILLSDINMPEMDGLTLLSKLNERNLLIKSIIVSAYGDLENIRTAMNKGAFDFLTKPIDFEDLQTTIQKTKTYVDQLRETMRAIQENNILKMYVDETALKFMTNREFEAALLENETIEASVVFIDICKFTSLSEKLSPNEVVQILNQYFDLMVKEIIAHDGMVDKFIGDAIMAVFKGPYHLDRSIEAALAIRKKIYEIDPTALLSPEPLNISVGINSGEMISGNIGSRTLKRLDYTVIGDIVNTAQRLQSVAEPGQILINKRSFEKINEYFKCKIVGSRTLKNKEEPVEVYEVIE